MSNTIRLSRISGSPVFVSAGRSERENTFTEATSAIAPKRRCLWHEQRKGFRSDGLPGPILRTAVACAIAIAFVAPLFERPAWGQNPDFSNVTDILGGQNTLLRYDDLLVTTDVSPAYNTYMLKTSGGQISSQSGFTEVTNSCGAEYPYGSPHRTKAGRVFDLPNDVIVSVAPSSSATGPSCSSLTWYVTDPANSSNNTSSPFTTVSPSGVQTVLADFNFDGYADIFTITNGLAVVATAANTADPTQGITVPNGATLTLGPAYTPFTVPALQGDCASVSNTSELAVGDFNGDGILDVAWLGAAGGPIAVYFATVCPGDVPNTVCSGATPFQILFWSQSITVGTFSTGLAANSVAAIAAGNFDGNAQNTELLVIAGEHIATIGCSLPSVSPAAATVYSFNAGFTPQKGSTLPLTVWPIQDLYAVSARLDWFGQTDQVVVGMDLPCNTLPISPDTSSLISVISFDSNLSMTAETFTYGTGSLRMLGLAVGRFDPPPPGSAQLNFTQQISVLLQNANSGTVPLNPFPPVPFIDIFTVNPPTSFTPTFSSRYTMTGVPATSNIVAYPQSLAAGDLQGRSLLLGPPQKVTVTGSIQPQVTLGLPPMHLDYVCNITQSGCSPSSFTQLVQPSKYFSQYQTQQSSSNQSSNTNTTSYTASTKETVGTKFSYGVPDVASISADLQIALQQTHSNNVAAQYNTYTGQAFDISAQTGFSDLVWFTGKRFNTYVYRVLGQCVPSSGAPAAEGCPAGTAPMYVQFSGPDQVTEERIDGSLLEWYQPVQEPGNIFSYPWNPTQLGALYTGFDALTADPATTWFTDSSGSSASASWNAGSGNSVTSGTVSTQSFNTSVSVSASVNVEGFGAGGSTSFDYNSSNSISTLNESSSTMGASSGVKIVKPPFINPGLYAYAAQTYIFGQNPANPPFQVIPLSTTVQSGGPLWTAFTADPTAGGSGSWWAQTYTLPDVALNHPSRWTWTPPTPTVGDVLTFNAANSSDPADSEFYWMKGLFITPASSNGQGPQITQATAGDQIQLQARVYNYSLADMPGGSTVHVRFYVQQWNPNVTPPDFVGDASPIGNDVLLGPIPGFNSTATGGQNPNWAMASTQFDTTNYSDQYLIFWVLVWMEDGNGNMVAEMPGHGLTALPTATTTPLSAAIESYSNNVGYYRQSFYVVPPTAGLQAASGRRASSGPGIRKIKVTASKAALFKKSEVAATLTAKRSGHLDGVLVHFYDGDPKHGGKAFDQELVSRLRGNDTYTTKVKFQPRSCGLHHITVVAGPGTEWEERGSTSVDVGIDAVASVNALTSYVKAASINKAAKLALLSRLTLAQAAFVRHWSRAGEGELVLFIQVVKFEHARGRLTDEQADAMIDHAKLIMSCTWRSKD